MTIEIVDFPIRNGGSFHSYVKLPEGILKGTSLENMAKHMNLYVTKYLYTIKDPEIPTEY